MLQNGYWHARGPEFLNEGLMKTIEWLRLPGDLIFSFFGVVPLVIATGMTYWFLRHQDGEDTGSRVTGGPASDVA